jgi:hypothetical protein
MRKPLDHHSQIGALFKSTSDFQRLRSLDEIRNPFPCISDKDRCKIRQSPRPKYSELFNVPTERAIHRCPAAPKAAPATAFNVRFLLAAKYLSA